MTESVLIKGAGVNGDIAEVVDGALFVFDGLAKNTVEGNVYFAQVKDDLGNNASLEMLVRTPADASITVTVTGVVALGGDGEFLAFEGTTVSSDGTPVNAFNRNRRQPDALNTLLFEGPTVTAPGTEIVNLTLIGGTGPSQSQGSTTSDAVVILKAGTNYLLRLTNTAGGTQPAQIRFGLVETTS